MNASLQTAAQSAGVLIEDLASKATRHETRFDRTRRMVWHEWGQGPCVVLFHGGFGSWRHWAANVVALSKRYRVIAADIPGLGESDLPDGDITPERLGEICASGLTDIVASEPVHLVAFSFGGVVSGAVSRTMGSQARSITLCGASGMGLRRDIVELVRRTPDMNEHERFDAQLENLKRLMLHRHDAIDPAAVYIHFHNDAMARLRSRRMSMGESLAVALREGSERGLRVNGIWGEYDCTARPWIADRAALINDVCPDGRFAVIADAGHWVSFEKAEVFNATLIDFLESSVST